VASCNVIKSKVLSIVLLESKTLEILLTHTDECLELDLSVLLLHRDQLLTAPDIDSQEILYDRIFNTFLCGFDLLDFVLLE
jgi:hypothetical protein